MPVETKAIGKQWTGDPFEVEAERIDKYANAVGEEGAVHHDSEAAKAAGFRDVVAPPMFAVVYQFPAMAIAGVDPEVGMNIATLVHGGQEFEWGEPVCAGDELTTEVTCKEIYENDGKGFYVFEAVSTNQDGAETVKGTWTNIVRGV
jgi:acyl dehydratase